MFTISHTILLEGAHKTGKSSTTVLLNTALHYCNSHMDRGFASTYAFGRLFDRPPVNLDKAIHDYFANPTAVLVYFSLWQEDYQADFDAGVNMREQWCGFVPQVSNAELDKHILYAIDRAAELGYSTRILRLKSRAQEPALQARQIQDWLLSLNLGAKSQPTVVITKVNVQPTDPVKEALGLSLDCTDRDVELALYDLLGVDLPAPEHHECPFLSAAQGVPIVTFEGTDGLHYSVGFAHPGLSSVAQSCEEALSSTKTKIFDMLSRRDLSPAELSIAKSIAKALAIGNDYTPKDTILSISNNINHAFVKYGSSPMSESSTMLACQIVLALPSMSEANKSFARSHTAKSTATTGDLEAFVKSRIW
jgi:hypothetical protein